MRRSAAIGVIGCWGLFIAVAVYVPAERGALSAAQSKSAVEATTRIATAAQALLRTLPDAELAKVLFPFGSAQKAGWSNLPTGIFPRQGLRMGDLTAAQRAAVMSLLQTSLSSEGYRKVIDIIRGDEVLRKQGGGGGKVVFGEDEYYLAFLGVPSTSTPWMLQFGGHHLAINLTLSGSQAGMTPSLPAAQPAKYSFEGKEIRPLGDENDKAFALINALDAPHRDQAILKSPVSDLVLGPGQDGKVIQPEGVRASALPSAQQTMLIELVREWTGIMHDSFAEPRMAEIRANLPQTWFAWSGPTTNGSMAYFRIQGPTVVIEYAPQKNVDHIHTIYRDPTNDYGARYGAKK